MIGAVVQAVAVAVIATVVVAVRAAAPELDFTQGLSSAISSVEGSDFSVKLYHTKTVDTPDWFKVGCNDVIILIIISSSSSSSSCSSGDSSSGKSSSNSSNTAVAAVAVQQ